jgi:two-component system, LytTR family, response regulator
MTNCIIIDDEPKARLLIRNMLLDECPEMHVLAECDDLPSGVKAIKKLKPNIVFLDIEMPGHSGLEILDFFEDDEVDFDIVFCTGYSDYAIQAFKLSATDYILKPISPMALKDAVDKYEKKIEKNNVVAFRALQHNLNNTASSDKCIVVNLSNSTRFIKVKDIVMLHAEGSYCEIFLQGGEKLLTSKNLKHFEERLQGVNNFYRCHKSYMVNLKNVMEYSKSENEIKLEENLTAMVSIDKVDVFLQKMGALA